jgi:hypothetical protein
MNRYVKFDNNGFMTGLYRDDIFPIQENEEAFLITDNLFNQLCNIEVTSMVRADNLLDTIIIYDDITQVLKPVPIALDTIKAKKINELKLACENSIVSGFQSSCLGEPKMFDCQDYDQRNILGLAAKAQLMLSGGQTDGLLEWKATGEPICYEWTPQQVFQLGSDMYTHISTNLKKEQNLRIQVNNATTIEEINAIVWE